TNRLSGSEACFTYSHDVVSDVPWSIHIFKIRREHPDFEFDTTLGGGRVLGMETVSDQLRLLPPQSGKPVAAINGDFYDASRNYQGRPREIQIRRGELISAPSGHTAVWIDQDGNPHMSSVQSNFRVVWEDGKGRAGGLNQERSDGTAVLFTAVAGASTRTVGGVELILEAARENEWQPLKVGQTYQARIASVRNTGNSPLGRDSLILSLGP